MTYFKLNHSTDFDLAEDLSQPIRNAVEILKRDITKVTLPSVKAEGMKNRIIIKAPDSNAFQEREVFSITFSDEETLVITGADELGVIYGVLYISEHFLGIHPLWFWIDQDLSKKEYYAVPTKNVEPHPFEMTYRGWFINDEVCLIGWKRHLSYPPGNDVWEPVFESLLRLGGNMVLPGTDLPIGVQEETAAKYGLYLTHHHAEPLGAEMFKRAYPDKQASYKKHPDLYKELWKEAIERQKKQKVIWALSFRGQGDAPFWESDPEFDSPKKRGALISEVIAVQYDLIKEAQPDAECSVNLYGEISELYKEGHISLPKYVIKIWSDNGYGKMVSRRNGNVDNRISTLPENNGKEGVYYHVTFHDLQASNHLTMFPNDMDLIISEMDKVKEQNGTDYILLNAGNIRMHTPFITLISQIWKQENVSKEIVLKDYVNGIFNNHQKDIVRIIDDYSQVTMKYGEHDDQRAGEQLFHYTARRLLAYQLSEQADEESISKLHWLTGDVEYKKQLQVIEQLCNDTSEALTELFENKEDVMAKLVTSEARRFHDLIGFQIDMLYYSHQGLLQLIKAIQRHNNKNYVEAFIFASRASWSFEEVLKSLKECEHDKWKNFYEADWLTNVSLTLDNTELYRNYLRMQEDHTVFFNWYKTYIMPDTEKHIYLENTHRENLSNDKLAALLIDKVNI